MLLDIVHLLYGYLYDNNTTYLTNPDYAQYYNFYEWRYILENNGFKYIHHEQLFSALTNEIRYDNLFCSFFYNDKKKKSNMSRSKKPKLRKNR